MVVVKAMAEMEEEKGSHICCPLRGRDKTQLGSPFRVLARIKMECPAPRINPEYASASLNVPQTIP